MPQINKIAQETMETKSALIDMIRDMNGLSEVDKFAEITFSAVALLKVERCYLFMYHMEDEILHLAYSVIANKDKELCVNSKHDFCISVHLQSVVSQVSQSGKAIVMQDLNIENSPFGRMNIYGEGYKVNCSITLPIVDMHGRVGAILHCVNKSTTNISNKKKAPRMSLASSQAFADQLERIARRASTLAVDTSQVKTTSESDTNEADERKRKKSEIIDFKEKLIAKKKVEPKKTEIVEYGPPNKNFSSADIESGILICEIGSIPIMYAQLSARAAREQQKRIDIQRLMDGISASMNPEDISDQIIDATREILNVQTVTVWIVDNDRGILEAKYSYDESVLHLKAPMQGSIVGSCVTEKKLIIIDDAYHDNRFYKKTDKGTGFETHNVIAVPIPEPTGEVIAVIQAINKCHRNGTAIAPFTKEDKKVINFMASQAGIALMKARLHEEARDAKQKGDIVLNLVRCTSDTNTSLIDISDSVCNSVADLLSAERVTIYYVDPTKKELYVAFSKDAALQGRVLKVGDGIAGKVAKFGKTIVVDDAQHNNNVNKSMAKDSQYEVFNMLCAPVFRVRLRNRSATAVRSRKEMVQEGLEKKKRRSMKKKKTSSMTDSLMRGMFKNEEEVKEYPIAVIQAINKGEGGIRTPFRKVDLENLEDLCIEIGSIISLRWNEIKYLKVLIDAHSAKKDTNESSYIRQLFDGKTLSRVHATFEREQKLNKKFIAKSKRKMTSKSSMKLPWKMVKKMNTLTTMGTLAENLTREFSKMEIDEDTPASAEELKFKEVFLTDKSFRLADLNDVRMKTNKFNIHDWNLDVFQMSEHDMVNVTYDIVTQNCKASICKESVKPCLLKFLEKIAKLYKPNPFHNLYHGFSVMHGAYLIVSLSRAIYILRELDALSLFIAGFCHDVDHPGNDNMFERKTLSSRALLHNDTSVLERHHCAVTFKVLMDEDCKFTEHLSLDEFEYFRKTVITCILATDLVHHSEMVANLSKKCLAPMNMHTDTKFDSNEEDDRKLLMQGALHSSDLGAQTLNQELADKWSLLINDEFKAQISKQQSRVPPIPVIAFMKNLNDPCVRLRNQIMFIDRTLAPLWDVMASLFPDLYCRVEQLTQNRKWYADMQKLEESKKDLNIGEESGRSIVRHLSKRSFSSSDRDFFSSTESQESPTHTSTSTEQKAPPSILSIAVHNIEYDETEEETLV